MLVIVIAVWTLSASAQASGGASTDSYDDIEKGGIDPHGLADVYFQGGLDKTSLANNQLRAFDVQNNLPALGMLRLTLAHKPDIFGFRLDAGIGAIPDAYLRLDPASATHPGLSRGLSYIEQAFVTANIPIGRGLEVDVGKFGTPVGLEDNEALENWNYSRSLLYLVAEPSYHAGLRITCPLSETLAVSVFWVNGWNANVFDGNAMRAGAAAVSWRPAPRLEVVLDYMGGLERPPTQLSDPILSLRHELDAYVKYGFTRRVAMAWTGDYGHDGASGGVSWWGLGGYVRVEALDFLAGVLRLEHLDDSDGFTSGAKQRLAEVTATLEVRGRVEATKWIGRLEYRRDESDEPFFTSPVASASTHQDTFGASLLAAF